MKWIWPMTRVSMRHPVTVIVLMAIVSVISVALVRHTKIDTDLANLLPEGNPHVETLVRLTEKMGAEDNFQVIITSSDMARLLEVGETFASKLKSATLGVNPLINQVEFRNESDIIEENFLYFLRQDELTEIISRIEDEIEKAKLKANPFFVELDEDEETSDLDINEFSFQLPPEYVFSADSSAVMLTVYPNGSKSDISFIDALFEMVDAAIIETKALHPELEIEIYYGGAFSEYITKFNDLRGTLNFAVVFGIVAVVIFLIVYLVFLSNRYVHIGPLLVGPSLGTSIVFVFKSLGGILLALSVSLFVTFATAFLMFGELNIMTTVLIAILLGVNIDYVLHFYSVYLRERSEYAHAKAIKISMFGCGKALFISCLTTGLAMLALLISEFSGFYEFGVIFFIGVGSIYLVTCSLFVSMLTVLKISPIQRNSQKAKEVIVQSILSSNSHNQKAEIHVEINQSDIIRDSVDHGGLKNDAMSASESPITTYRDASIRDAGYQSVETSRANFEHSRVSHSDYQRSVRFVRFTVLALGILVIFSIPGLFLSSFEYNFGDLEPKSDSFSEFNQLKDSFETQRRSDPAYFLFNNLEDASAAATLIRNQVDGQFQTVGHVESFAERFPVSETEINERLGHIESIRLLLEDPFLVSRTDSLLEKLSLAASQTEPISMDLVPDFFKNRFTDRDGDITGIVVINPNMMLADGRSSMRFKQDAGQIDMGLETYYAASTSIIAASILEIITDESRVLIFLPLLITLICLVLFFRSLKWGLLTFAPLLCALVVLAGIMGYVGFKFNLYNLIVLPAILGVGADNGIHLFHRIRDESMSGFGAILRSTGYFITASSITTALGFVGLIFTNHPGLQSMGIVATGGILLTLVTSIVIASGYCHYNKGLLVAKPKAS